MHCISVVSVNDLEGVAVRIGFLHKASLILDSGKNPYRRKDDNRRLRVEIAIRAIASEFTIA